jgi:hypothetical protein
MFVTLFFTVVHWLSLMRIRILCRIIGPCGSGYKDLMTKNGFKKLQLNSYYFIKLQYTGIYTVYLGG